MKNAVDLLLEDMTYNTRYEFLEEGKHKSELEAIAKKRGIKLPARDLAPFKARYAFVDRQNKNGCVLPKEEVKKALETLNGKAIDFDHFRKNVVGYWIDSSLDGDEILATGMFLKGNFPEDYEQIKKLMEQDVVSISFEAWGKKDVQEDGSYNLRNIEFAGGALLLKEKPAFPGSEVLEMSEERVLELAKILTKPDQFIHSEKGNREMNDLDFESARYYISDIQSIMRMIDEVECMNCKEKGWMDIQSLDFANNKANLRCVHCDAMMEANLTPSTTLTKKGRQIKKMTEMSSSHIEDLDNFIDEFDGTEIRLEELIEADFDESKKLTYETRQNLTDDQFAVVKIVKTKSGKDRKIRMFPIHDPAHVRNALARLAQAPVQKTLQKLGVSIDNVRTKILKRARQLNMKSLLERYKKGSIEEVLQEIAKESLKRELKEDELLKTKEMVETKGEEITEEMIKAFYSEFAKQDEMAKLQKDVTDKTTEVEKLKTDLAAATEKLQVAQGKLDAIEEEKVKALVTSRRAELREFAKDMKDEDIRDDAKYEVAKLKKENADLKAKLESTPTGGGTETKPDLIKGAADKEKEESIKKSAQKVNEIAWGKDLKKKDSTNDED